MKTIDTSSSLNTLVYTDWTLTEYQFDLNQLNVRETVFTIGNGYLSTRGSFEEGYPRAMPATLIHGIYDQVPVVFTELVNCPDWLPFSILINDDGSKIAERFRLDQGQILRYERRLDLRKAILTRSVRWQSESGKILDLHFERFASLADPHVLCLRCLITPINFAGMIEVQSSINGYAENQGFNHWEPLNQGQTQQEIWLQARTRQAQIELSIASKLNIQGIDASFQVGNAPGYPTLNVSYEAAIGQTALVEKVITVFTSREVSDPLRATRTQLAALPSYPELFQAHKQTWEEIWQNSDVVIEGDTKAQLAVRYNLFQLLISAPHQDDRVSIPAKTLSGFGYRGHVFWDTEVFMLPYFIFTQPEIARNLLSYRYHTLKGARRKAASYGYKGAMYAWESADTGDDVTPRWAMPTDPYASDVRIWCRDREIHISADIAYAVWQYWQATEDDPWMRDCGAEIILDTAIFWMSRVEWNSQRERYEIKGVIGADEYHEHVNNNAFTNRMAQWNLETAVSVYDWLQRNFPDQATELEKSLEITPERRSRWQDIATHLWIPYNPSTEFIEQFEGFCDLEDIDLEAYEPRTQSMQALLGIEGANKRQVLKQPDVLMLLFLMRQFQELPYSPAALKANWNYYAPRTDITYGSSLGPSVHAILAANLGDPATAYEHFMQAALVDLENTRGNTTDGIHGASAGGVWQAIVFGFGGIQFQAGKPVASPHLPPNWTRLQFKLRWRNQSYPFDLHPYQETTMNTPLHSTSSTPPPPPPPPSPHPSPNIQGAIFDLDGVLTDTAEYHYRGWQRLADEEGLPFDRQANEALRGVSRRESLLRIVGNRPYSEAQLEEMMDRKNRYYQELIQTITPADLLPGALAFLKELRQDGIKIAIASASKNARTVIEKLEIAIMVDIIADGYSVQRPKPAPDLFLYAANQLKLPPYECVVFEDAAAGIEAALAAGMWAVGLGPAERVGAAHVVLSSLEGVTWSDLTAKLRQYALH